jgi:hypothetical protein
VKGAMLLKNQTGKLKASFNIGSKPGPYDGKVEVGVHKGSLHEAKRMTTGNK